MQRPVEEEVSTPTTTATIRDRQVSQEHLYILIDCPPVLGYERCGKLLERAVELFVIAHPPIRWLTQCVFPAGNEDA